MEFFDWAGKAPGLIDFALTTSSTQSAQETHAAVTRRLEESTSSASGGEGDGGLGVRFKDPLHGGRKRKDGQMVEWYVTKPRFDHDHDDNDSAKVPRPPPLDSKYFVTGRLDTPFFCHDVTDRSLRVPYAEPGIAQHPSGAKGILSVEVVVPREHLSSYARLYASITGVEPKVEEGKEDGRVYLRLASPDEKAMEAVHDRVGVVLRAPRPGGGDEEWIRERGVGIKELNIYVPGLKEETRLDGTGIGSSVVLVG